MMLTGLGDPVQKCSSDELGFTTCVSSGANPDTSGSLLGGFTSGFTSWFNVVGVSQEMKNASQIMKSNPTFAYASYVGIAVTPLIGLIVIGGLVGRRR